MIGIKHTKTLSQIVHYKVAIFFQTKKKIKKIKKGENALIDARNMIFGQIK